MPSGSESDIQMNTSLQKNSKSLILNRPKDLTILVATESIYRDIMAIKVKFKIFQKCLIQF